MDIVDATCEDCGKVIRWAPGRPRICTNGVCVSNATKVRVANEAIANEASVVAKG